MSTNLDLICRPAALDIGQLNRQALQAMNDAGLAHTQANKTFMWRGSPYTIWNKGSHVEIWTGSHGTTRCDAATMHAILAWLLSPLPGEEAEPPPTPVERGMDSPLVTLVEQLRDWAERLETRRSQGIIPGLRDVASDLERSRAYQREQTLNHPQHGELIEAARTLRLGDRNDEDIEVDADACLSEGEDGCWVSAWVWISHDEVPPLTPLEALASVAEDDDNE